MGAYTKLSCFLPWIAAQYGMDFKPEKDPDPRRCSIGTPRSISMNETCLVPKDTNKSKKREEKCQNIPSSVQEEFAGERDCIFPFYYNGRKYNECIVFTDGGFVYPVFRCPIYNITRKVNGINNFTIEINRNLTETPNKYCPGFACQIFQTSTFCVVEPGNNKTEHLSVFVKTTAQELGFLESLEVELWHLLP